MKRALFSILLALVLAIGMSIPVYAANGEENWQLFSESTGGNAYLTINPTNLQISSFTLTAGARGIGLTVYENGVPIYHIVSEAYQTNSAPISGFKFHRLPLNDPDDPGSTRYPNNTTISVGTGEYWY